MTVQCHYKLGKTCHSLWWLLSLQTLEDKTVEQRQMKGTSILKAGQIRQDTHLALVVCFSIMQVL